MATRTTVFSAGVLLPKAGQAWAAGYRIPEQSLNSVALSNASVAHTPNAAAHLLAAWLSYRF